jgi:hypothetical protein
MLREDGGQDRLAGHFEIDKRPELAQFRQQTVRSHLGGRLTLTDAEIEDDAEVMRS